MSTNGEQDEWDEAYEQAAERCDSELQEALAADAFEDDEGGVYDDAWFDQVVDADDD